MYYNNFISLPQVMVEVHGIQLLVDPLLPIDDDTVVLPRSNGRQGLLITDHFVPPVSNQVRDLENRVGQPAFMNRSRFVEDEAYLFAQDDKDDVVGMPNLGLFEERVDFDRNAWNQKVQADIYKVESFFEKNDKAGGLAQLNSFLSEVKRQYPSPSSELCIYLEMVTSIYLNVDKRQAALKYARAYLNEIVKLFGSDHAYASGGMLKLAEVYQAKRRFSKMSACISEALAILRPLNEPVLNAKILHQMYQVINSLSMIKDSPEAQREALFLVSKCAKYARDMFGSKSVEYAKAVSHQGNFAAYSGKKNIGVKFYERSIDILIEAPFEETVEAAQVLLNLGHNIMEPLPFDDERARAFLLPLNDLRLARKAYEGALTRWEVLAEPPVSKITNAKRWLARVLYAEGNIQQAFSCLDQLMISLSDSSYKGFDIDRALVFEDALAMVKHSDDSVNVERDFFSRLMNGFSDVAEA